MGYQPFIDSYSDWIGPKWTDRKDILAWSAGPELVLRIQQTTESAARQWRRANSDPHRLFCQNRWFIFKTPDFSAGKDDITSLKLLRPVQYANDSEVGENQQIILGRASGDLRRLHFNFTSPGSPRQQVYATRRQKVSSIDVSASTSPLLIACLGDSRVALYRVHNENILTDPISEIELPSLRSHIRLWSSRFLSEHRFAVGTGPSSDPLSIYSITPQGISQGPLRSFEQLYPGFEAGNGRASHTSIYAISPLSSSSTASNLPGEVFLSGAFDGKIRLHDLRSSRAVEGSYYDATDDSAIYSLATLGRERVVSGTARHSMVKFFDLRISGGRAYHYLDTFSTGPTLPNGSSHLPDEEIQMINEGVSSRPKKSNDKIGWNLFLNPREMHAAPGRGHSTWSSRRSVESPVYSLSMPSSSSPTLFAGVENAVVQLDFASVLDRHPDPVHANGMKLDVSGAVNVKHTWNIKSDVLNLAMYEQMHGEGGEAMRLKVQKSLESKTWDRRPTGLDDRWKDSSHL